MSAIPYDWKGTATTNQFTEERILESDIASDRVLVLQHRPFFQSGFSIRQASATNPLTPGVDYELAYQLTELDDSVASPVFCGVNVINPAIKGTLIITGYHLGGTFYDGLLETFDELVKYLNNPTSASWYNVDNRPSLFPVMPAATSWHDLLNKKYVASAIHDVELDAGSANDEIKAKLEQLRVTVESLQAEITAFDYPSHINAKNPHGTTATQIDAHPISLKAADTFLAYGKKFRQLTTEVRALGLQQSDIDKYIETYAFKDIQGTFVQLVQANRPLFKSQSGASSILFTDTGFDLKTTGGIALRAGYKGGTSFFEWVAGGNVMRIESSGSALGMDKLTLNGTQLLTTTTLMDYQESGDDSGGTDPDDSKLYVQSQSVELTYKGKGSKADPVSFDVALPNATVSSDGAVSLVTEKSGVASGQAVKPSAVAAYDSKLGAFVPKATRLNSVAMDDGSRTLTKADLGLDAADNTADVDKPLSEALQTGLDGKSAKTHTHAWASLNVPNATTDDEGIIRIATTEAALATGRGTAPNVLYQLQLQLAAIADKLKDADPKAVTDYAVIGASTWTVASSKLSVSVQDLKYFFMADGSRKEGKVTGSVNLETTPMFNWFQPTNVLERNWAKGVVHNTQLTLTSSVTTLPLYARTVGLTASQVGDLSVISVLAKERVSCSTGRLRVMAVAGGNISLYIDGALVASGAATVDATFDVDPSLATHCVAFRADCNDSSKPAALAFEIWDTNYPIVASSADTKLVQLAEFVSPLNNRHFLYLNMNTGSMFGRAEPIASDDINTTQCFIGFVDCGATGVATTTVAFDTMADFGQFGELTAHQDLVPAHVPESSDWYLTDNQDFKRVNIASDTPDYIAAGAPSGAIGRVSGMISASPAANPNGQLSLWLDTQYNAPQQWKTPANPYENNLLTYEGSLVLILPPNATAGSGGTDLWLTFAQKAKNGHHKFFHLNVFTDVAEYGYMPAMASNPTAFTPLEQGMFPSLLVHPYDISSAEATDPSTWGADDTGLLETRYIVRYRFVPKTLTLRVQFVRYEGSALTPTVRNVTYEMPFDVRDCMGGFVGFNRMEQTTAANHALAGAIFPSADYHNYSYFRSLFECYVRGADFAAQGAGRGLQQKFLYGGVPGNWGALRGATEYIGVPQSGNAVLVPPSKYSPLYFRTHCLPHGLTAGSELTRAKLWSDTANPNRGAKQSSEFGIAISAPVDYDKVDWSGYANYAFTAYASGVRVLSGVLANNAASSNQTSIPVVGYKDDVVYFDFMPNGAVPAPFFFESTISFYKNGTKVATVEFGEAAVTTVMSDTSGALYLCKFNPFNLTTTMWDWVSAAMQAETGVSSTLGVWN
ncbi:hypothetical protein pEaSNUABM11_00192 [Erwinia phage pEa_SNUABM_11]|nr:hypothetical protein pEaSNUABM11_00192 [Erwinia phage pEa_SNUABM_11]